MTTQRPRVPTFRVPRTDRPFRAGFVVAVAIHLVAFVLVLVRWEATQEAYARAIGGFGPLGGGGGGGGAESVQYIELPPLASAPRVEQPRAPTPPPPPVETPEPEITPPEPIIEETDVPTPTLDAFRAPPTTIGLGSGLGSSAGAGAGSGGGIGTGQGTGIGTGEGPGTGGDGGSVLAPEPRSVIYPFEEPPGDIKGSQFAIRFWVDERGRVTQVEIEPEIADRKFRDKLLERLRQWRFYPARTLGGEEVKGQLVVSYSP